jgi:hypothetical protein
VNWTCTKLNRAQNGARYECAQSYHRPSAPDGPPANFFKGVDARISTRRAPFVKQRTRTKLPTLAAAISYLISIAATTIITIAILSKLVILVIGVLHPATIVRHIFNQSFIFMSSSMSSSCNPIAMCE